MYRADRAHTLPRYQCAHVYYTKRGGSIHERRAAVVDGTGVSDLTVSNK